MFLCMSLYQLQQNIAKCFLESFPAHAIYCQPKEHLSIHYNNIVISLSEAITANYPILTKLVGESCLHAWAKHFIKKHPPKQTALNLYGATFVRFIATIPTLKIFPFIRDVAHCEWMFHQTLHQKQYKTLSCETLQNIPIASWPHLKFKWNPDHKLYKYNYPVHQLWSWYYQDQTQDLPNLNLHTTYLLLYQTPSQESVAFLPLDETEYMFLSQLKSQKTFEAALAQTLSHDKNFHFMHSLLHFIEKGCFLSLYESR